MPPARAAVGDITVLIPAQDQLRRVCLHPRSETLEDYARPPARGSRTTNREPSCRVDAVRMEYDILPA
jgi:hypothetical protein